MLDNFIFREIDNLSRNINNIYEQIFRNYGLQRGQFLFISRIVENNTINLKSLADILRVDKTTVTKAINKLAQLGYITKQKNSTDSRIFNLTATDKGIQLYNLIIQQKNLIILNIIEKFNSQEIDEYINMTRKLNNSLDLLEY